MLWQPDSRPQRLTPRGYVGMPNAGRSDYRKPSEHSTLAGRWLT